MDYRVLLKNSAEKELERLPVKTHDRIVECLLLLREIPVQPEQGSSRAGKDKEFELGTTVFFISLMTAGGR